MSEEENPLDSVPEAESPRGYYGLGGEPTRYICTVLEEMRKCNEQRNYAPLLSQIEEIQILGNRMEAALELNKRMRDADTYKENLKEEIKALEARVKELRNYKEPEPKGAIKIEV